MGPQHSSAGGLRIEVPLEIAPISKARWTSRARFASRARGPRRTSRTVREGGLDRVDAQHELVGDLEIGRRRRELVSVAIRAAKGDQHPPLRGREVDLSRVRSADDRLTGLPRRSAIDDRRVAEAQHVAVHQAASLAQPLPVDDRAVAVRDRRRPTSSPACQGARAARERGRSPGPSRGTRRTRRRGRSSAAAVGRPTRRSVAHPWRRETAGRAHRADRRAIRSCSSAGETPSGSIGETDTIWPAHSGQGRPPRRSSSGSRASARSSSCSSSRMMCTTALISARCVNACGKFPRWRPVAASSCSA